jgi:hypothetical protein
MDVMDVSEIPEPVRACLWFSDPEQIDWGQQKVLIITSVLNRGTWPAVRWIFYRYGEESVREAIKDPQRGLWFPHTLHFWQLYFDLSLPEDVQQKALIRI